jgi:tRNA-Thr(GGU) m(6)t(6)A37 methyltransferase TsaA
VSDNKVSLLDRLLAIPVAVYFWWYEQRQKIRKRIKTFFRHRVYRPSYERVSRNQGNPAEYRQTGMQLKPIGVVGSELKKLSLTFQNRDLEFKSGTLVEAEESISELILDEDFIEYLDGIEGFSHIMVVYWAHQIPKEGRYHPKVHPGGRKDFPLVGVFATRSPARPNPICVTTVELLERKGNILKVRGLDAVDGSPLVDIKPHIPSYNAPSNVRVPDWVKALTSYFSSLRQNKGRDAKG